jgi:predicted nucleotidyltransferase
MDPREIGRMLSAFHAVSVREEALCHLLQPYCSKRIALVMDPTLLVGRPEWEEIAALKGSCFSKKAALHHYYGIAGHTLKEYLTGDKVKYKKYFYALRPLLCCRWIRRFHEAPPVEFSRLLTLFEMGEEDLTPALYGAIEKLLAKKAVTEEKDLNPQMPEIIGFIEAECKRQKALLAETKDDRKRDMQDLNECFFSLLKEEL